MLKPTFSFSQELIVRELMEQGKSLVVDGSLADAGWYVDYIQNIRQRYTSTQVPEILRPAPAKSPI